MKFERKADVNYFNIYLEVGNENNAEMIGNDIFFKAKQGEQARGEASITNNLNEKREIKVSAEGELVEKGWLVISESKFKLNPQETKPVRIIINIPVNAAGNYSGKLKIEGY